MSDDVRRVSVVLKLGSVWETIQFDDGSHALMPWSEYERLRAELGIRGPESIRALWSVIDALRRRLGYSDDSVQMVVDSMIDYYCEGEDTDEGIS